MLITKATFYAPEIPGAKARVDIVILGHIQIQGLHIMEDKSVCYPSNIKPSNATVDTILRGQMLTYYWDYAQGVKG